MHRIATLNEMGAIKVPSGNSVYIAAGLIEGKKMATYIELKAQAEKLLAQAEQMRQQERETAIADIKAKIEAFGLTAQELGLRPAGTAASAGRARAARKSTGAGKAAAKYRGPNGETWSGGRGRKPKWVTDALASGKKLEDFAAGA